MKKFKRVILLSISSLLIVNSTVIAEESVTYTTSAVHSLNNEEQAIDYKTEQDTFDAESKKAIKSEVSSKGNLDKDETSDFIEKDPVQNLSDLSIEKSYLIYNNILSRKFYIENDNGYLEASLYKDGSIFSSGEQESMKKSDLLMMLYKAEFGVIGSRFLRFSIPSIRNGSVIPLKTIIPEYFGIIEDKDGNTTSLNAYFDRGDYFILQVPDVYENYFYQLLNKGIIEPADFGGDYGTKFLDEYYSISSTGNKPSWWYNSNQSSASKSNIFGYSYYYSKDGSLERNDEDYFEDETLYTIEALELIESFLRATEKEMTNLESNIISYKYGLNYLQGFSSSEQETIKFLIAKGILNFENQAEFINLYGEFTNEIAYRLLYRVANKNARFDFSEITLTDSESYWNEEGYTENNISLYQTDSVPSIYLEEEENIEDTNGDGEGFLTGFNFIKDVFEPRKVSAATTGTYKVTKDFDTNFVYYYQNKTLESIYKGSVSCPDLYSIKKKNVKINGINKKVYHVVFKVKAKNSSMAELYVSNNIRLEIDSNKKVIEGVTRIESSSGKQMTLVSASTLKENFTDITILEDKVLQNKVTGVTATILPEEGYALVGNTIIKTNKLLILDEKDEVYYNLRVIASLLSNTVLTEIDGTRLYEIPGLKETERKVFSEEGVELGTAYVANLHKAVYGSSSNDLVADYVYTYNIDSITTATNTLVRTFDVKNSEGIDKNVTVVVDWQYVVPTVDDFNGETWTNKMLQRPMTISDVTDILYKRPTDKNLQIWWDSNYGMSNALANFMYGTKGEVYIKCGYLAPSITILKPKSISESDINRMFLDNDFLLANIDGISYSDYVDGTTSKFWKSYYNDFDQGSSYIQSLAKANRKFTMYDAKSATGGYSYSTEFFKTSAGVLYRAVSLANNMMVDSNKNIVVYTRNTNYEEPSVGTVFEYNNKEWVYRGTVSDGKYLLLQPNFVPKGDTEWPVGYPAVLEHNSIKEVILTTDIFVGRNSVLDTLDMINSTSSIVNNKIGNPLTDVTETALWTQLKKIYKDYFVEYEGEPPLVKKISSMYGASTKLTGVLKKGNYYLYNGGLGYYNGSSFKVISAANLTNSYSTIKSIAIPKIYLPTGDWYIYKNSSGNWKLGKGAEVAALNFNSVFQAGLSKQIQDTIMAKYVKTTEIGKLKEGYKVYIGNTLWTKKGDVFISTPIKNSALVKALKKTPKVIKNNTNVIKASKNIFNGLTISADGLMLYLTNYFSDYRVGTLNGSSSIKDGIVFRKGNNLYVRKNGKNVSITKSASYAIIQMKINSELLVRPINKEGTIYTIVYSASTGIPSLSDNLPFFSENLSFKESRKAAVSVDKSLYGPSAKMISAKKDFMSLWRKAFSGDLYSLAKLLIIGACSLIIIMSWACYLLMRDITTRQLLETLSVKSATTKNRNGIDLVKYVTLGIYNLDQEITILKSATISILCSLLIFIVFEFL